MTQNESQPARILFLTNSMGTGGVGNQLYNISTRLQQRGYDIKIVSLSPLGRFGEKTAESGIDVRSLELTNKLFAPFALYRVRKLIRDFDPDIVHTQIFHATILGRVTNIGTGVTTISTIHSTYETNPEETDKTIREYLYRLTDRYAAVTTFVSDAARDRFVRVGAVSPDRATRIYNGVDTDEFRPADSNAADPEQFTWIAVGNLQEQKDHKTLLEAVARLVDDGSHDFRVSLIGEGELRDELEATARRLDIMDVVTFEGRVEPRSVPDHLNVSDAFVLPSLWEGFGLVVPEAMACELPVVATNTGGPLEIVEDGETGFLAERGSPKDLAEKMKTLMELSPEERAEFGARGRQRIKDEYSIEQTVSKWQNIYEEYR